MEKEKMLIVKADEITPDELVLIGKKLGIIEEK